MSLFQPLLDAIQSAADSLVAASEELIARSLVPLAKAVRRFSLGSLAIILSAGAWYLAILGGSVSLFLWLASFNYAKELALSSAALAGLGLLITAGGLLAIRAPKS